MTPRSAPRRHWRPYGNEPLPSPQEALNELLRAFPSWFLRIECDRCGKTRFGALPRSRLGAPRFRRRRP
jgi:hypothetical protein